GATAGRVANRPVLLTLLTVYVAVRPGPAAVPGVKVAKPGTVCVTAVVLKGAVGGLEAVHVAPRPVGGPQPYLMAVSLTSASPRFGRSPKPIWLGVRQLRGSCPSGLAVGKEK